MTIRAARSDTKAGKAAKAGKANQANINKPTNDKPFKDALRLEIASAAGNRNALRKVARALLEKASGGDVAAIRELADRLDGKLTTAAEPGGKAVAGPELNAASATEIARRIAHLLKQPG